MRVRRKYVEGRCDDCGWTKPVTQVTFWATGLKQKYCKDCIRPYRKILLKPNQTSTIGGAQ